MDKFLLDTNVIIDAFSAKILECLNYSSFYVSQVVFKEEIAKQIPTICNYNLNLLNESYEELISAQKYADSNKKISFYDALCFVLAKERKMILVTGDQNLINFAKQENIQCIGTLKLIEILVENNLLNVEESVQSLIKLKLDSNRRIPHKLIDQIIQKIQSIKELVK